MLTIKNGPESCIWQLSGHTIASCTCIVNGLLSPCNSTRIDGPSRQVPKKLLVSMGCLDGSCGAGFTGIIFWLQIVYILTVYKISTYHSLWLMLADFLWAIIIYIPVLLNKYYSTAWLNYARKSCAQHIQLLKYESGRPTTGVEQLYDKSLYNVHVYEKV